MTLASLEGIASNIRTDTSVQGSVRRGKGNVSSTTTMNFLVDGKAVNADFGESMSINDGDHVVVAGVQKTNGLKVLAYNNLTNGTYGEGGKSLRIGGIILAIVCFGLGMAFIGIVGFLGIVIPVLFGLIGIWLWWLGHRAKTALALCRQASAAVRVPSAA